MVPRAPGRGAESVGLVVSSLASFQDRSVTATPCHYTGPARTTRPLLSSSSRMIYTFSRTLETVDTGDLLCLDVSSGAHAAGVRKGGLRKLG